MRLARGIGTFSDEAAGVGASTLHARVIVRAASMSVAVALQRDVPCDMQAAAGVCLKLTPVVHW